MRAIAKMRHALKKFGGLKYKKQMFRFNTTYYGGRKLSKIGGTKHSTIWRKKWAYLVKFRLPLKQA